MKSKTIGHDVLAVLSLAVVQGFTVQLTQQLERKLYVRTNDVLEALGGKWDRKCKAHRFTTDPAEVLDQAIMTGRYEKPQDFGFFPTPAEIVARVIEAAVLDEGDRVLEPSAGQGAIAEVAAKIVGIENVETVELLEENCTILKAKGFLPHRGNFLEQPVPPMFDRIVMNPPFAKQQDIDHVLHAFKGLKPGGRLVSVMSIGFTFRQDRKAVEFREFVDRYGSWEPLPEAAFKDSGTMVRTVLVRLDQD